MHRGCLPYSPHVHELRVLRTCSGNVPVTARSLTCWRLPRPVPGATPCSGPGGISTFPLPAPAPAEGVRGALGNDATACVCPTGNAPGVGDRVLRVLGPIPLHVPPASVRTGTGLPGLPGEGPGCRAATEMAVKGDLHAACPAPTAVCSHRTAKPPVPARGWRGAWGSGP